MLDDAVFSELPNWNEYVKIFIAVFARVSPPFIVPLFLGVVGERPLNERIGIALVAAAGFAVTMIVFTFLGHGLLELLGITLGAFRFAGGVLLMLLALKMINTDQVSGEGMGDSKASWVSLALAPLAIPILAGPGSISTIVIFASQHDTMAHKWVVSGVVLVNAVYIAGLLCFVAVTKSLFGRVFTSIFSRLMGLMVLAIAFEFIMDGLASHFPILKAVHEVAQP